MNIQPRMLEVPQTTHIKFVCHGLGRTTTTFLGFDDSHTEMPHHHNSVTAKHTFTQGDPVVPLARPLPRVFPYPHLITLNKQEVKIRDTKTHL